LARAVVGDESDNIDGVPGVGLKTAAKRFAGLMDIETDHDVDWLLEQARNNLKASKKPPRCYADILENEEKIRRNWKLMFLSTDTLAASQIAKLNGLIDTTQLSYNYLEFIKTFACAHISITEEVDTTPSAFMFLKIS
jgi:5'-3' exonuclease